MRAGPPTETHSYKLIDSKLLLLAYRNGIFPMADSRDDSEAFWVEPRERATVPLDGFRCSRSLAKTIRQDRFRVTCDAAFAAVIAECSFPREEADGELSGSWISRQIEASYIALHEDGHAHSVECWEGDTLVGGLYGVAFDRVFCGESMFSRRSNASKVALAWLVAAMRRAGYQLLDCQFMTDHLASLGAQAMPQSRYLEEVRDAAGTPECSIPQAIDAFKADQPSSPGKLIAQSLTQTS